MKADEIKKRGIYWVKTPKGWKIAECWNDVTEIGVIPTCFLLGAMFPNPMNHDMEIMGPISEPNN